MKSNQRATIETLLERNTPQREIARITGIDCWRQLKYRLCEIDGNGSSIHVGLLTFEDLIPTPMKTSTQLLRNKTGESIPSIDTDPQQKEAASPHVLVVRSSSFVKAQSPQTPWRPISSHVAGLGQRLSGRRFGFAAW